MDVVRRAHISIRKLESIGIGLSMEEKRTIIRCAELLREALGRANIVFIPGHDVEHMFRVMELSIILQRKYGGDFSKVVLSALFHDILRTEKNHAEKSAKFTEEFLRDTEFRSVAKDIATIIREHSYSSIRRGSSLESMILQDADRLDALGAIGIARVFSYGAHLGRELYDPVDPSKGGSLEHFYRKILRLPETMNTELAKRIAMKRLDVIKEFIEKILEEIQLRDITVENDK